MNHSGQGLHDADGDENSGLALFEARSQPRESSEIRCSLIRSVLPRTSNGVPATSRIRSRAKPTSSAAAGPP